MEYRRMNTEGHKKKTLMGMMNLIESFIETEDTVEVLISGEVVILDKKNVGFMNELGLITTMFIDHGELYDKIARDNRLT